MTIARNNPGKLNFGSSGFGNATHLAAEWFKAKTAVDVVHVPYKGLSEVVTGVLAGQVVFVFGAIEGLMPHIQDGQLRALAVTSEKRFPLLPDLPTMIESGVDGFVISSFQGVVAPAGTPPAVVARLNAAVNASLDAPETRAHLARLGATPATGTPQEFAVFFAAETRKWAAIVKSAGISVDSRVFTSRCDLFYDSSGGAMRSRVSRRMDGKHCAVRRPSQTPARRLIWTRSSDKVSP